MFNVYMCMCRHMAVSACLHWKLLMSLFQYEEGMQFVEVACSGTCTFTSSVTVRAE